MTNTPIAEDTHHHKLATQRDTPTMQRSISLPSPTAMTSYESLRQQFTWQSARDELDRLGDGGLNIAHEPLIHHV